MVKSYLLPNLRSDLGLEIGDDALRSHVEPLASKFLLRLSQQNGVWYQRIPNSNMYSCETNNGRKVDVRIDLVLKRDSWEYVADGITIVGDDAKTEEMFYNTLREVVKKEAPTISQEVKG